MSRPIVYIAAPFSGSNAAQREWNTLRAETLCLLAVRTGRAPICVHSGILRGAYGDDEVESDREGGLEVDLRLLEVCDEMWVLICDDGSLSEGVHRELSAFRQLDAVTMSTWSGWSGRLRGAGLADRAASLEEWTEAVQGGADG